MYALVSGKHREKGWLLGGRTLLRCCCRSWSA